MGNKIESEKILNLELDKSESKIVSPASIATAYYFLENYEKTYSYLELAIKEKDPWLTTNFNRFKFNKIANKEKFKYIKRTINLTAKP